MANEIDMGNVVGLIQAMMPSMDAGAISASVTRWLDAHPEATTTVADGSITEAKLAAAVAEKINEVSSIADEIGALNDKAEVITKTVYNYEILVQKGVTETLPEGITTGTGYIRGMGVSNPGNISSSSGSRYFTYTVSEDMLLYVPWDKSNAGSTRQLCVYNQNGPGTANRVTPVYASNNSTYPLPTENEPLNVKAGQVVAFSAYNTSISLEDFTFTLYVVDSTDTSLNPTVQLTSTMDDQVQSKILNFLDGGYYHLVGGWNRHGWDDNGTSTDSRDYRVRHDPITFEHDTYAVMQEGFLVAGYADGVFFDARTVTQLLHGVEYKLYVRRYTEDGTEVADVATFANALKISTGIAPIELYQPTFTDVSMFERVGVCGDSYASGGGIISGIRPLTWGKNLERQAGITVDIYAKSGQNVMQWVTDTTNGLPALLSGPECGLYWLQHGINGTSTAEQFGTLADIEASPHPDTFCGQYTEAVEQIKTAFPNARIILATIIGSSFALYQSTYAEVNTAIRAIAEHCGVMLVDVADDDFYRSGWYSAWIRSNHPTAMQCAGIAMANRRLISKCIQEHGDYFVNYGNT